MTGENEPRDDSGTGGVDRRSVLRKTAVATAAGLSAGAFSGGGAARRASIDEIDSVAPAAVEGSLESTGSDVLELLADDGLLSEASAAELRTRDHVGVSGVAANREGTATVRNRRGVLRHVTVTHVDGGVLTVTVEPDEGRAYAFFEPEDGGARLLYDPAKGLAGVDPNDVGTDVHCTTTCNCTSILCDSGAGCIDDCETCCCDAETGCSCTGFTDCCGC